MFLTNRLFVKFLLPFNYHKKIIDMGFGGSVQAMITSIRNNARPKTDIFTKSKNDKDVIHTSGKPLKYKEVSEQELEKIKDDIRLKAENERRRIVGTVLFIVIALVVVLFYLIK